VAIDLRPGDNDFRVTTQVKRDNNWYMGPEVIVTARDEEHAKEIARSKGHEPNPHFPPEKIRKR
jgi:hypothetical protein